jgi:beta-mannosidase
MHRTTLLLGSGWTFTQIGGQGTDDVTGEWLETSTFPTSVHVELLNLRKIPDPVSSASCV